MNDTETPQKKENKSGSTISGIIVFIIVFVLIFKGCDVLDSCWSTVGELMVSATPSPTVSTVSFPRVTTTPPKTTISQETPSQIAILPSSINMLGSSSGVIERDFSWYYSGNNTWSVGIPQNLYDYYKALDRPTTRDYSIYAIHSLDDEYINGLAGKLMEAAQKQNYSEKETVEYTLAFVQSLPYTYDWDTTSYDNYPRYPIETLADNGGDCEDTSILLAALLKEMGYDVAILILPEHAAVGVSISDESIYGISYIHDGIKYYYVETTAEGYAIGQVPESHSGMRAYVYPLKPVPILDFSADISGKGLNAQVEVLVKNLGTKTAWDVSLKAGFDAGYDTMWNSQTCQPFSIGPGGEVAVTFSLKIPVDKHTRLVVYIVEDGYWTDKKYTEWFDT